MAKAQSNKQLSKTDRDILCKFALANVACPDEEKAFKEAFDAAKPHVLAAVHKRYPVEHMLIMQKYGATRRDECVRFGGPYDNDSVFEFDASDPDIPLIPRYTDCYSAGRGYEWTDEARKLLFAYAKAKLELKKAQKAKYEDYRILICGSRTFNDVVAVWPAAEKKREVVIPQSSQGRALAVLSEEAIARIKADNAGGEKVAA